MGFSVSASFGLLMVVALVVAGTVIPAWSNGVERTQQVKDNLQQREIEQENTELELVSATYNASGNERVTITVNNTGTSTLVVNDTSVLVENEYQTESQIVNTTVDGDANATLWLPGEQLKVTTEPSNSVKPPSFVKLVTEYDIAVRATL